MTCALINLITHYDRRAPLMIGCNADNCPPGSEITSEILKRFGRLCSMTFGYKVPTAGSALPLPLTF